MKKGNRKQASKDTAVNRRLRELNQIIANPNTSKSTKEEADKALQKVLKSI
ncbi:MAG: hypothetical protein ABJF04_19655 [Reichenbachiella sp.]|uniref:hypothetical protein n=1 Tax=Reichenbachiella sp. TaxID=2184521 RepID=UPI003267996C